MWSLLPGDRAFGPQLEGQFDFTLLFEQVMMTIVPGGVIALSLPYYLRTAIKAEQKVRSGFLLWAKLVVGVALLAIHTAALGVWYKASLFQTETGFAAAGMSLVASVCTLFILYISHTYSLQPSAFLSIFLTLTALFDITITRSYFRREGLTVFGALQAAVVILKLILVALEEVPKRNLFTQESVRSSASVETVSGFWNRVFFAWLNPLLLSGSRGELHMEDLPAVEQDFDCAKLYDRFLPLWNKTDKSSKYGLLRALVLTEPWQAVKVIPPRLMFVGLNLSQPFLLFRVVDAVNVGADGDTAHGLMGATALIFGGITVTRAFYEHLCYRIMTSFRGILVYAIYDKMNRLSYTELEKTAAVTLMTGDTLAVEQMISLAYELWSSTILLGLGVWALSLFVGHACFLMLIPGILVVIASRFLGKAITTTRAAWNQEIQNRVAATSNILAQIKGVKAAGLAGKMVEYLEEKRQIEITASMPERRARVWLFGLSALSFTTPPLIVLAGAVFWTRASDTLDAAEVFTIITIVIIAAKPYMTLLTSWSRWSTGLASLQRIQAFLCLDDIEDARRGPATPPDEATSTNDEKKPHRPPQPRATQFAVQFQAVALTSKIFGSLLKDVNLGINWGDLAIFWGSISSGKSTFLRCIIGEEKPDSGVVTVGTRAIAYSSQEPWLQNKSLRENVVGMYEFIESRYRNVLRCCQLDVDIASMNQGDLTVVGSNGTKLSGGQIQRVSLARAAYAQTDVMVVDDAFSALDPATARAVFENLFGPQGLVRQWNCTVIMSTNRLEFLKSADVTYRIHQGGKIEKQEKYVGDGNDLSIDSGSSKSGDEDAVTAAAARSRLSGDALEPPSVKPTTEGLDLRNAREKRRHSDWSLYVYLFRPAGVVLMSSYLLYVAFASLIEQMPIIFVKIWFSTAAGDEWYFAGYLAFCVANFVLNSLNGVFFFFKILPKTSVAIHSKIARAVLFASPQYLSRTDAGNLLNRFGQDIMYCSQHVIICFMQFTYVGFTVLIEIGIISGGSPYAAPITLFLVVGLYFMQDFYLQTSRQLRIMELESASALYTHFAETSSGIRHVRTFRWQRQFQGHLERVLNRSQRPYYLLFCCQRWLHTVLDSTAAVAAVILVVLALSLPKSTTSSAVGLAMLNVIGLNDTTSFVIRAWTDLEGFLGAVSRIKGFSEDTPSEQDKESGLDMESGGPDKGQVQFDCVSASYEDNDGNAQTALDNVSFTIQPGEKVIVCGRTGSGKSTLLMTLLRMVEFTGAIRVDNRSTTSVPRERLRQNITTLTQDGVLLRESMRLNLYPYDDPPTDDDMIAALQSVRLWDHVREHGGLDGNLVDMGFSPSKRQLLFVARAVLHRRHVKTKVVVMDEATSAMDDDTNTMLQDLFDEAFAGCTVVQVAHREESIRSANVRIRLDGGRVASVARRVGAGPWVESR